MNESQENLTPQPPHPTSQDLQNLEIEVSGLGRGDIIHLINTHMGILRNAMKQSEKEGWPDWLLEPYNENLSEIRKLILETKMQKAKELGL
jgi:hypothetical protein